MDCSFIPPLTTKDCAVTRMCNVRLALFSTLVPTSRGGLWRDEDCETFQQPTRPERDKVQLVSLQTVVSGDSIRLSHQFTKNVVLFERVMSYFATKK